MVFEARQIYKEVRRGEFSTLKRLAEERGYEEAGQHGITRRLEKLSFYSSGDSGLVACNRDRSLYLAAGEYRTMWGNFIGVVRGSHGENFMDDLEKGVNSNPDVCVGRIRTHVSPILVIAGFVSFEFGHVLMGSPFGGLAGTAAGISLYKLYELGIREYFRRGTRHKATYNREAIRALILDQPKRQ